MNKTDLVKQIVSTAELSPTQAERCLSAFTTVIAETLSQGDRLVLPGFGTFAPRQRAARIGRNPQTGAELEIPASIVPTFKAGQGLKNAVNS